MTISVVDRDEQEDDVIKYANGGLRDRDVAQERETSVFTVRLTRVNAGLN